MLPHFDGDLAASFFALAYPIADLILISLTLAAVMAQGISKRGLTLATGVLIFSITDFLYLGMHVNNSYSFGSLIDDGWLLGILIIAMSFHCTGPDSDSDKTTNPIFITLSVFKRNSLGTYSTETWILSQLCIDSCDYNSTFSLCSHEYRT